MTQNDGIKLICKNRKAFFNFEIEDTFEAGISLLGSEVKSLRSGKANLSDSYGKIVDGELFLVDAHISPYAQANRENHEPLRDRKLLIHKRELKRLTGKVAERGFSLIPLKMYFKRGRVKVEMALARGKKTYDKRETIKKKDQRRELERLVKYRQRSS
ncbi:SsrA-binding protein SmpB [Desulfomonile tiedjei]|uniref:SsrA-binding protein n=1 Tax=Desulfomonile tiedjei (strain ATCC 49306 / DSM 6799 / DCB-1) TaxID=706587 RepID=I4CAT9_DESTA|nr:SsrA-binding protein SmpB [Desulfomonile tiedjei]AFM26680.1 SsrA-binding protein [Desulfomonile tiedjei DSM 6799]